jgi:hypothetical protein
VGEVQLVGRNEEATETMTTCKVCQKAEENGGARLGQLSQTKNKRQKEKETKQNKIK